MSIKRDKYFVIKDSNMLFNATFGAQSIFLTNILSFLTLSSQRIKELLHPKLIRSFDVAPVQVETKKF